MIHKRGPEQIAESHLPQNIEAEAAMLGAMMIDNRLADDLVDTLDPDHFFEPLHGRIFAAIRTLRSNDMLATPVTLRPMFEADAGMRELGGPAYLAQLTGSGAGLLGAREFAKQIYDLAMLRTLVTVGRTLVDRAMDTSEEVNPRAQIEDAEQRLAAVSIERSSKPAQSFGSAWRKTMHHVRAVAAGEASQGAMIARLTEWNDITGGMVGGQLILLGGRPGMGKTDLALAVSRCAAEAGVSVLFISREMPVQQLILRLIADLMFEAGSRATFDDIRCGKLSDADMRLADDIGARIDAWPLIFEEVAQLNANGVRPMIRTHQRRLARTGVNLGLVVLDYTQLLEPPQRRGNREQEMSDISRALKGAAIACDVPLVALSQLNRAVEQREDKRPLLADLRDSGSLEQDADAVIFVYRAEYYLRQTIPDAQDVKKREAWELDMAAARNRIEVYSAKSRQIDTQRRTLYFFGANHAVRSDDHYRAGGHSHQ
jgi:replicative DNA helicase